MASRTNIIWIKEKLLRLVLTEIIMKMIMTESYEIKQLQNCSNYPPGLGKNRSRSMAGQQIDCKWFVLTDNIEYSLIKRVGEYTRKTFYTL